MEQPELSDNILKLANAYIVLKHSTVYRKFDKEFMDREYNSMLVLSFLLEHGKAVVSHELANALVRSTPQMAVLFNHMEKQGYIERLDDADDARQTIVKITPAGEEVFRKNHEACRKLIREIFETMGEEESTQFVASFGCFLDACSKVCLERSMNGKVKGKEAGSKG